MIRNRVMANRDMERGGNKNRGANNNYFYDESSGDTHWTSWLIPAIVVANLAVFVAVMFVNDCPKKSPELTKSVLLDSSEDSRFNHLERILSLVHLLQRKFTLSSRFKFDLLGFSKVSIFAQTCFGFLKVFIFLQ